MAERLYTLAEITGVLGAALKRVPAADRLIFERPLNLFLDDVARSLQALPPEGALFVDNDFASPND